MRSGPISLESECAKLTDLWSPRIVGRVNDTYIKVAKVHGEFPWHEHTHEDEMFLVLRGCLRIGRSEAEGGPVELHAGDSFIVPRRVRHKTAADEETWIALIEAVSTQHTGDEVTPMTRSLSEQLAGFE